MILKSLHRTQGEKPLFETLPRRRIYEAIVNQIKEAVFRRELKPGDRLPSEKEMMRLFGVSNMAVREAMRTLEQQGLLQVRKGSGGGCFISEVNRDALTSFFSLAVVQGKVRLSDLTEVRLMVEPELTKLATLRGDTEDVKALEELQEEASILITSGSRVSQANIDFHGRVAIASGNDLAVMLVGSFRDLLLEHMSARTESKRAQLEVQKQHARIIEAVKKRDPERAGAEMREHILWLDKRDRQIGRQLTSKEVRLQVDGARKISAKG
ncbi:MAG TPA: FadR/GntR family transcriptional regulator [bacterium]|nr:FadR/GntR family transcriptional regulator [bacterium]